MEPVRERKYPRMSVDLPVQYAAGSQENRGHALMLGGGGMFIGTSQSFAPGAVLTVRFRPAKHLPVMEAKARVCYLVAGQGIGIEFTEIEAENRKFILRLIHHRKSEQRRFPRVPLATQVLHDQGSLIGFSRDISNGGMFIETNQMLDPGTRLNLRFHLDPQDPIVKAEADILYEIPKIGIGLQFTEVLPEDYDRIRAYVAARNPKGELSDARVER
jgi:c-di-GMP-binding flagellar brake protein YcgR